MYDTETLKLCLACSKTKPLNLFPGDHDSADGHQHVCLACKGQQEQLIAAGTETRTCARCGQEKRITEFDRRFVFKPVKVYCAACRGIRDEEHKWQDAWVMRRDHERHWQEAMERWQHKESLRRQEESRSWQEELQRREEESQRRQEEWLRQKQREYVEYFAPLGFSEDEQHHIGQLYYEVSRSNRTWGEIKELFRALTPPYIGDEGRGSHFVSKSVKHSIYVAQQGTCFYCHNPIIVDGEPELVSCLCFMCYQRRGRIGFYTARGCLRGQVDHKTPRKRGGSNLCENLCYACTDCNQCKGVRTAEEFARYPSDPISLLDFSPRMVMYGMRYELRGFDFGQYERYCRRRSR